MKENETTRSDRLSETVCIWFDMFRIKPLLLFALAAFVVVHRQVRARFAVHVLHACKNSGGAIIFNLLEVRKNCSRVAVEFSYKMLGSGRATVWLRIRGEALSA